MRTMLRGLLLCCCFWLLAKGSPLGGLGGEEVKHPFGDCKIFRLGGREGLPFLEEVPMRDGSQMALYPLSEHITASIGIMLPDVVFHVTLDGSMITLEKCNRFGRVCEEESREGVMHPDYIQPQMWSFIQVGLSPNELSLKVGPRMVKSISMDGYNTTNAFWSLTLKKYLAKTQKIDAMCLVQLDCKDHSSRIEPEVLPDKTFRVANTPLTGSGEVNFPTSSPTGPEKPSVTLQLPASPSPSVNDSRDSPSEGKINHAQAHVEGTKEKAPFNLILIVVAGAVAVIVLLAALIFVYNVLKRRRSADMQQHTK